MARDWEMVEDRESGVEDRDKAAAPNTGQPWQARHTWKLDLDRVRIDLRGGRLVVHHHCRERDHQAHHDALDHDEGHGTPINLPRGDRLGHLRQ